MSLRRQVSYQSKGADKGMTNASIVKATLTAAGGIFVAHMLQGIFFPSPKAPWIGHQPFEEISVPMDTDTCRESILQTAKRFGVTATVLADGSGFLCRYYPHIGWTGMGRVHQWSDDIPALERKYH